MNTPSKRVYVYYSRGRDLQEALSQVRAQYPGAQVCAVTPPSVERAMVEESVSTELSHYTLRNVAACRRLIKQIRSLNPDVFVTLFMSPRLGLLAALTRAPEPVYCGLDGQLHPLSRSVAVVLATHAWRVLRGRTIYALAYLWVHLRRV